MAWHPFRNIPLKIVALGLSVALWYTVSGREVERRLSVPITYSNVPAPLVLTGDQLDAVSVQVRGSDNLVGQLDGSSLRVVVDLRGADPGSNIIPLRPDQVEAPLGVEVLQLEPGTVTVDLDREVRINVLVKPTIEGRPARGFQVRTVSVEPRTVTVAGPERSLHDAVTVVTERIVLDGRTDRVAQEVGVGVADAQLRVIEPHTVRVTVEVTPVKGDR